MCKKISRQMLHSTFERFNGKKILMVLQRLQEVLKMLDHYE
jgi:hypothetical protein